MNFKELEAKRAEFKEHNDCSVKSVAVSCGVSYEKAHAALKEAGRKNRGTAYFTDHCKPAIESLGFEVIEETFPGKTVVTLERDLKRYARGRKFFVTVRKHFLAFNGEQFVDWAQGRRHRVKKVYRVKRVDQFAELERVDKIEDFEALDKIDYTQVEARINSWMREQPRPRGAPKKGTRVVQHIANNESFEGEVVGYLASQFVIDDGNGERVIAVGDDWKVTS